MLICQRATEALTSLTPFGKLFLVPKNTSPDGVASVSQTRLFCARHPTELR